MRFRLRTLLIVLAAIAALLARIGYSQRMAAYHRREASSQIEKLASVMKRSTVLANVQLDIAEGLAWDRIRLLRDGSFRDSWAAAYYHTIMARRYKNTVCRPWRFVSHTENANEGFSQYIDNLLHGTKYGFPLKSVPKVAQRPNPPLSDAESAKIKAESAALGAPQPVPLPPGFGELPLEK